MKIIWILDQQLDTAFSANKWKEIVKYLQERHNITFYAKYKYKKIQVAEIVKGIHYFKSSKIPYLHRLISYIDQLKKYEKIIKKYLPDFVLFNTHNFFLIQKVIDLKELYKPKLILDVRSLVVGPNKIRRFLDEFFFRNTLKIAASGFDGITYITEEMKNYCAKKYNLKEHKSCIWSSGVNANLFRPMDQINKGTDDKMNLIYHGSIVSNRGIQNVIEAISKLQLKNIYFSILGAGEGSAEISRKIKYCGLINRVKILKPVPYEEVPSIINAHDIGILPFACWPGWNTSSPIKLFEYLACGIPVIATRIPAHINALRNKNFVIWADSASPDDIAEAIIRAYKKRSQFGTMGKEARDFVINNYTWEKQAQKLDLFLQSIYPYLGAHYIPKKH